MVKDNETMVSQSGNKKIAVIGQGYVGLPLSIELARHFPVVGFDVNSERIQELTEGIDRTQEADIENLKKVLVRNQNVKVGRIHECYNSAVCLQRGLIFTNKVEEIKNAQIYIVTVPTPIDRYNAPDLKPLRTATRMLGSLLKRGDIVIYESTVYPGCTEEVCVPLLEESSRLIFNRDFFVGYSPERINPGDKLNTLTSIVKVTSGSTPEVAEQIDQLYKTIILAGTHKAPSIKVAEASKAIENAQRDINISFVNELSLIFDRMGIDTNDVLDAAATKFNFLKFKPGLVGGHCISVDPFYLAHKAAQLGYHPDVILSGRRVNDQMGNFIASKVVKLMTAKNIPLRRAKALILGITFKENCSDVRNTKVIDIYNELIEYGLEVDVFDPIAEKENVRNKYGISDISGGFKIDENDYLRNLKGEEYDVIILAVAHEEFKSLKLEFALKKSHILFDVKAILPREIVDGRL